MTLPFPELFDGIKEVFDHNAIGHPAYLFGKRSHFGWWYYYPVGGAGQHLTDPGKALTGAGLHVRAAGIEILATGKRQDNPAGLDPRRPLDLLEMQIWKEPRRGKECR